MRKSNKMAEVPTWDTVPDHVLNNVIHFGQSSYRDHGRGFVMIKLLRDHGPDNWSLSYMPPAAAGKLEKFSISTVVSIRRNTAIYDPAMQVSVILFDHRYPNGARTAILQDANALSGWPLRASA